MAKKSHPILTVLVILFCVAVVLSITLVVVVQYFAPASNMLFEEKIGVVPINGTISSSRKITEQLLQFRKDEHIKAVILRINSPGGAVGASQEIHREVQKVVSRKPVVAAMGSVAASGGYYAAAAASRIVANPGTITGSIGVFVQFIRLEKLFKNIGVDFEIVKSGEFKAMGSPDRKLTERDRQVLDALIKDLQGQFVWAVALGRNLSVEKVQKIADGRIFSGAQAKAAGLVDVLGNFQDAVDVAKELAGIKGEVALVYPRKSTIELWHLLFESAIQGVWKALGNQAGVQYRWDELPGTIKETS